MTLSYNLAYQEIISVHPTRRQIFAGKPYSTFPNIWEWVIFWLRFILTCFEACSLALSYNLAYQEIISVHPTRSQIFAGKTDSTFWNIWQWVIPIVQFLGPRGPRSWNTSVRPWIIRGSSNQSNGPRGSPRIPPLAPPLSLVFSILFRRGGGGDQTLVKNADS